MSYRKTTLSQYSSQLLQPVQDIDMKSNQLLKKSTFSVSTDYYSPDRPQDSLDSLVDQQSVKKSRFFFSEKVESDSNTRYLKTESDEVQSEVREVRPFRFRRKEAQPKLDLEDKNDVEDFFTGVEIPRASQQAENREQYKLVSFTDYVENIYGKEWFSETRVRKFRRQITVQDFFETPC